MEEHGKANRSGCVARGKIDRIVKMMESSSSSSASSSSSTTPSGGGANGISKVAQSLLPQEVHAKESNQITQVDVRKLQPEWLERFFRRTFFNPCSEHPIRRNELNKYCIDCDASLCQYCLSLDSHPNHRVLKIYRHVYKDVVPLDEIEQHIDCSQIQPYRCNKQLVIALTPLPHSGGKSSDEATCQTCRRKLIEYHLYNYCSITCKVEAFSKKDHDYDPPFFLLDCLVQEEKCEPEPKKPSLDQLVQKARKQKLESKLTLDQLVEAAEIEVEPKRIKHRRKGTPHRAPFS